MTIPTCSRSPIRTLGATLALTLGASAGTLGPASAHQDYPNRVEASYASWTDEDDNTVELTWSRTAPTDGEVVPPPVYVNWCKAKRILPPNWDVQSNRTLRTTSMCEEEPLYGSGGKKLTAGQADVRSFSLSGSHEPERYIASVSAGAHDPGHHNAGEHTTLALVHLEAPEEHGTSPDPVSPPPGQLQPAQ